MTTIVELSQEAARDVWRTLTSRRFQQTVLYTSFLSFGCVLLYALSVLAYLLFYWNFLPNRIETIPVHLQYGLSEHPFGVASLTKCNIKEQQAYDINVVVSLPRSPPNLQQGNFMTELHLLKSDIPNDHGVPLILPPPPGTPEVPAPSVKEQLLANGAAVSFSAYRPALLPYADPLIARLRRLIFLPYHVLFPAAGESRTVTVTVAEKLWFSSRGSGTRIPKAMYVELKAGQALQTYGVEVTFVARLGGLAWLMYNFKVPSFLVLTTLFWMVGVAAMVLAFAGVKIWLDGGSSGDSGTLIKREGGGALTQRDIKQEPELQEEKGQGLLKGSEDEYYDGKKHDFDDGEAGSMNKGSGSQSRLSLTGTTLGGRQAGTEEEPGYEEDTESTTTRPRRLSGEALTRTTMTSSGLDNDSLEGASSVRRRSSHRQLM